MICGYSRSKIPAKNSLSTCACRMGGQRSPDLVLGVGRELRDSRNRSLHFSRVSYRGHGERDSARAQSWGRWARASASQRHLARAEVCGASPYGRLGFRPPVGFFGGAALFLRGSICASTDPANDCTCFFESLAGLASPTPAERLTFPEVRGEGGLLVVLGTIGTPNESARIAYIARFPVCPNIML